MTTGFGETAGNPDNYAGAGVVESVAQLADSCNRASEGDVAEIAMNGAAVGLDALGFMLDPLGSLATAGLGWLIEHVSFLREPLDWFAGDPDEIKAACATWNEVAMKLDDIGTQQDQAVQREVQSWKQAAAEAFRKSHGRLGEEMHAVGAACTTISTEIANAGAAIGAVRGMIRDLITTFVWEVIRNSVIALAGSVVTFGGAAAAFAAWTVGRAAMVLGKVAKFVTKIVGFVGRMLGRLKGLFGKLGDLVKGLGRFGKGGSTPDVPAPTRTAGTDAPSSQPGIGQRLEDWGRNKAAEQDPWGKTKDGARQFGDAYKDAGNRWENFNKTHWQESRVGSNFQPSAGGQRAADQYTQFSAQRNDGTFRPHSVPDVANGGFVTKFSGDLARELSKADDMQNEVKVDESLSQEEEQRQRQKEGERVSELRSDARRQV